MNNDSDPEQTLTPEETLEKCYEELATWGRENNDGAALARATEIGSYMSIIACCSVLFAYFFLRSKYPHLTNRVSLRLAVTGSVYDLLYSVFMLLSAIPQGFNNRLCPASMSLQILFLLMSLFTSLLISFNLLLVFVLKFKTTDKYERAYNVGCVLVAVIIAAVPLGFGAFGWDGTECFYYFDECLGMDLFSSLAWQWGTYYSWVLMVVVFCSISGFIFYWKASRPMAQLVHDSQIKSQVFQKEQFNDTYVAMCKAVHRIKWYCLVPLVAQGPVVFIGVWDFVHDETPVWLWWIANFTCASQGLLNASVFFIFDPSIAYSFRRLRAHIVRKYYLSYFEISTGRGVSTVALNPSRQTSGSAINHPVASATGTISKTLGRNAATGDKLSLPELMEKLQLAQKATPPHPWIFKLVRKFLLKEEHILRMVKKHNNQGHSGVNNSRTNVVHTMAHPIATTSTYDSETASRPGPERDVLLL
ncbi:hypothetical protein DFS34DRAFT_334370 [Phlyctochytrium arcticum]|nr:hypothetical protein DFS34DRAFT_334370 [Phlyctochytrium arcticum]